VSEVPSFDVYLISDQPECCRQCGARTNYIDVAPGLQEHHCPECFYVYLVEDDS
jgi:hypothetical protein